jgi:hypothetical protein
MADVVYLLVIVGFFGLLVLLVKACDHIIGPDDQAARGATPAGPTGTDAEATR